MDQIKIGKLIAKLRKEQQMTQEQLADKLGVTDRAVSKWENGRGLPDYANVKILCDILGITFDEFISGEKDADENSEEKHRENLEGVYKLFDKSKRKNNRILLIAGCIGIVMLLIGAAVVVDFNRMIHNRPVVFSSWGLDYVPSIDLEKEKIDIAIREYCLNEYEHHDKREGYTDEMAFVETNTFKIEEHDKGYYAYTWVFLESYGIRNGEVEIVSGYSIPHRFTVIRTDEGKYAITKAEIPKDGTRYEESMKKLFPKAVLKEISLFDKNGSIQKMHLNIQAQKDHYFRNQLDKGE